MQSMTKMCLKPEKKVSILNFLTILVFMYFSEYMANAAQIQVKGKSIWILIKMKSIGPDLNLDISHHFKFVIEPTVKMVVRFSYVEE